MKRITAEDSESRSPDGVAENIALLARLFAMRSPTAKWISTSCGGCSKAPSTTATRSTVKVYAKLPRWFQVPTPLGPYTPDWAVLIEDEAGERLYLVVETKGSAFLDDLRNAERAKVACGKAHFEALRAGESPARYRVVQTADELLA